MRNHGNMPTMPADPDSWSITVDGEVNTPLTLTLGEIKSRFENVTAHMVLECAGNGRSFFVPPAAGNQWTNGGVGCAAWTGVRLRDILNAAGVKPTAVYTAHFGADTHLTDPTLLPLSRGVPIAKAMNEHSLLVFGMDGEPLPLAQGGPARLLYPGFPGSASHKWITRIQIREVVHDGPGMTGRSYKLPIVPIVPGTDPDPANLAIIETMPLRSIITSPANGTRLPAGTRSIALRGHAWAGEGKEVAAVQVSADGGMTWHDAALAAARNPYDWHRWSAEIAVPTQGYYDVWTRAVDTSGNAQPHIAANWNPNGYNGNRMHEVAVLIEG
jgi:DMSO/TMAO reductase YedYZ molybdopterin-dependent catalytic subunit